MENETYYKYGDAYCIICAPINSDPVENQESDCPVTCSVCHRPLQYSLTEDGVKYVIEKMKSTLKEGYKEYLQEIANKENYYDGCPRIGILLDWADDLIWYNLDYNDERLIRKFISHAEYMIEKYFKKD